MAQLQSVPLAVCSRCGARAGLQNVNLVLKYTPKGNLLTWVVFLYWRELKASLPLCARCLEGLRRARVTFISAYVVGSVAFAGAFAAWVLSTAPSPFLLYGGLAAVVAAGLYAEYTLGLARPHVVRIDKSEAVLSIPGQGEVTVASSRVQV